jgi:N-hydroxyarylamine O-acetyltransferase
MTMSDTLPDHLRSDLCARLGVALEAPTEAQLARVYAAWCVQIPFDNVRKLIALREAHAPPLPGSHAIDFFTHWLSEGTGGTCWSSSQAMYALLTSLGFTARRIAGSMRDTGIVTHGSVIVTIDEQEWLVDSSALTSRPVPISGIAYRDPDPVFNTEWQREGDTHVLRFAGAPGPELTPCRFLVDPTDAAYVQHRYELSRAFGPFNHFTYARRSVRDGFVVLRGPVRYHRTAQGMDSTTLDRDGILRVLAHDIGISAAMLQQYEACGALDLNFLPLPQ